MKIERFCNFFKIWWANIKSLFLPNVVYSLMSMTLLPSGLASVGMTNVTLDLARQRYSLGMTDYFSAIKKCWKQALAAGLIHLILTAMLAFAIWFYLSTFHLLTALGLGLSLLSVVLLTFVQYYVWPQILMFQMPLRKVYHNAFLFAFLNLKNNLLIGFITLLCYAAAALVLLYVPYFLACILVVIALVCFFPGFHYLLVQYYVFPFLKENIIDPYYASHPDSDIEERTRLGLN